MRIIAGVVDGKTCEFLNCVSENYEMELAKGNHVLWNEVSLEMRDSCMLNVF